MKSFSRLNNSEHSDDGHYWISISDLMMSVLFIFILILTYTVFTMSKVTESYSENDKNRKLLLKELKSELKQKGINVTIVEETGNMRINSDTFFSIGSADLSKNGLKKIEVIANNITFKMKDKRYRKSIDTIFIEGHTDNVPIDSNRGGRRWTNMELSAQRAINTFLAMDGSAGIGELKNSTDKYLFSYSGYGDKRPIDGEKNIANNRRIEFFFALAPVEVKKVK
jgi:flagellar motor protein MotB